MVRALGSVVSVKPRTSIVLLVVLNGCYASHLLDGEPREEEVCFIPDTSDPTCELGEGPMNRVFPEGVCRLEDGTMLAFSDGQQPLNCQGDEEQDVYDLYAARCPAGRAKRRELASCGTGEMDLGASTLGLVEFRAGGRPPWPLLPYREDESRCVLNGRLILPNAEPWRPFVEADILCDDPYAWCGSPLVIELRQSGGDPCGGGRFTQRCQTFVTDWTIVVRAQTAEAESSTCLTVVGDRVARCVVPPLAAGRYDVVAETGEPLGVVDVPGRSSDG